MFLEMHLEKSTFKKPLKAWVRVEKQTKKPESQEPGGWAQWLAQVANGVPAAADSGTGKYGAKVHFMKPSAFCEQRKLLVDSIAGYWLSQRKDQSRLPHLACPGVSKRIDPLEITLLCQPTTRDSEGWLSMNAEHGVGRPEVWIVYIDQGALQYMLTQTCTFLDHRRPATRITLPLQEIRFCQDSCGKTFRNGKSLQSTMKELKRGSLTIADLGIRVVAFESIYFALDNRRLKCAKEVFPPSTSIPVLLVDLNDPSIKQEWASKFTAGVRISTHEEARQTDPGPTDALGKGKQRGRRGKRIKARMGPGNSSEDFIQLEPINNLRPISLDQINYTGKNTYLKFIYKHLMTFE